MTLTNSWERASRFLLVLVCLFVAAPAFAVSTSVQVNTPGQQPKAFEGAIVSLGGITAPVNSQGIATFEDVPAGEQELTVTGRNISHRTELVQVTEGEVIQVHATHVTALSAHGPFQVGVGGFSWEVDDWEIKESTNQSNITVFDPMGNKLGEETVDESTGTTPRTPGEQDGGVVGIKLKVAEVGGNSPWAAFYVIPMIGEVDAEISFVSSPGAPGCDCTYSGDGTLWGLGLEAVLKPDAGRRFFISFGISHRETETLDVTRSPGIAGVIQSKFSLEFEQDNATVLFGYDGDVFAPFLGVERVMGDARLKGDFTVDAPVIDPTAPAGATFQFKFDNKFTNDATLGVVGVKFRFPGTRFSGLARWAGDSDDDQIDLQIFFAIGGGRRNKN